MILIDWYLTETVLPLCLLCMCIVFVVYYCCWNNSISICIYINDQIDGQRKLWYENSKNNYIINVMCCENADIFHTACAAGQLEAKMIVLLYIFQ